MIPFDKSLFRSPWFVALLLALAISAWCDAIRQVREMQIRLKTRDAISELQKACEAVADARSNQR